jgi:hypothetical protein
MQAWSACSGVGEDSNFVGDIVPYKLIICVDILEELAISLFTVYLVKPGFMFLKGPFQN